MSLTDLISQYGIGTSSTSSSTSSTDSTSTLGKDDFLQLLVTQLKNQDPLDPVKNEDFIAQLAQFNSLEQMMNLNTSFSKMLELQTLSGASNFIGKQVSWFDSSGNEQNGVVDAVTVISGTPMLVIGNQQVSTSDIFAISNP